MDTTTSSPVMADQRQSLTRGWDVDWAQKHLTFASSVVTQAGKVAIALGGLLLVSYAAKERFFYDVSSLAAVGVLLVTLLSFGFLIAVGEVYGAASTLWAIRLFVFLHNRMRVPRWQPRCCRRYCGRRRLPKLYRMRMLYRTTMGPKMQVNQALRSYFLCFISLLVFLFFFLLAIVPAFKKHNVVLYEIYYFMITGFWNTLIFCVEPIRPPMYPVRLIPKIVGALSVTFILLLLFIHGSGKLLDQTMMLMSLRSTPGEPISLTDKAHERVSAIAAAEDVCFKAIRVASDLWLTRTLTLIWHGPGAVSFAALGEGTSRRMVIPLPSADVDIYSASFKAGDDCPTDTVSSKTKSGEPGGH